MMIRKANAVWKGAGRDGAGQLTTASGVLTNSPYGFKTRFENEPGTNPEELLAAAHAGCFSMALAFGLQGAGFTADEIRTEAAVTLETDGPGFKITRSALTLRARIPGIDEANFRQIAGEAEKTCPLSKVINAEITLDAALEG
jgi:osmotically inducible protein OsmC